MIRTCELLTPLTPPTANSAEVPMSESPAKMIERVGLTPCLRAKNPRQALAVVDAMIAGGITVVEVTLTCPDACGVLRELKNQYGSKVLLGSGTVTTPRDAEATIEAGAEFVVSPSLHADVIPAPKAAHKLRIPGALTPTKVPTAPPPHPTHLQTFPYSPVA